MEDINVVSGKGDEIMPISDINSRFNEIYNVTNKYILAVITAKCRNTSDISDIFQETYMELYKILNKHGVKYVKNEKAYIYRIAKHQIARYYSLAERLKMFVSMTLKNNEDENEEMELSDADIDSFLKESVEDYIINQTMLDDIKHFIKQKPANVEQIFYFFYEAGLSIPEIAQALSLTESNVKHKLYRTLKELRNLLNERWNLQ